MTLPPKTVSLAARLNLGKVVGTDEDEGAIDHWIANWKRMLSRKDNTWAKACDQEMPHTKPHGLGALPHHTFVVLAYRDSPYLDACLRSIATQTCPASRVVLTTSTPNDRILAAAERFGIDLAVNAEAPGIGSDWNFGLRQQRSGLLTLAHQDDPFLPEFRAEMAQAFVRYPTVLIAFSDFVEIGPSGEPRTSLNLRVKRLLTALAFRRRDVIEREADKIGLLRWGNPICCPSVTFNLAALTDFRFCEDMGSNLDWEAWARLALRRGGFAYIRRPLVAKRVHPTSATTVLIADRRRLSEDRAMFGRFWPRPMAWAITTLYRLGYVANRV